MLELLVVVGIIALLIALLLPAISRARAEARAIACGSNLRQVALAICTYAAEHRGHFPPNTDQPSPGRYWYDVDRVGQIISNRSKLSTSIGGGVLVCPEDSDSIRSYAMNVWGSSIVNDTVNAWIPTRGKRWDAGAGQSSRLILVTEAWSQFGSTLTGYYADATVGGSGDLPGQRFGGAGGISPLILANRFGFVNCELPFIRHRKSKGPGVGAQPIGRVNIAYADAHVQLKSEFELVNDDGWSTGDSLWTPTDLNIERNLQQQARH